MKRGYVLTWDSLFALMLVIISITGYAMVYQYRAIRSGEEELQEVHYVAENALEILNKKGDLDKICNYWVRGEKEKANATARRELDELIPPYMGYRLLIDGVEVTNNTRVWENSSRVKTRVKRLISGYNTTGRLPGWTARAWIIEEQKGWVNYICEEKTCPSPSPSKDVEFPEGVEEETLYLKVPLTSHIIKAELNMSYEVE